MVNLVGTPQRLRPSSLLPRTWVLVLSHELGGPISVLRGHASLWVDSDRTGPKLRRVGNAMYADAEKLATGLQDLLRTARLASKQTDPALGAAFRDFETIARPAVLRIQSLLTTQLGASRDCDARVALTCYTSTVLLLGLVDQLALAIGVRDAAGLPREVVDLERWTRELVHDVAGAAAARGHRLLARGSGRPCLVKVTAELLKAAVVNLIDNAQKHSPPGLPIVLDVKRASRQAVLSVHDRGPGLPDAVTPAAFLRVEQPLAFPLPGLGLGLVIAAEVAELNGGKLLYSPRDGGGSEFRIELPLVP
jgi:signal transduction histidine kinase